MIKIDYILKSDQQPKLFIKKLSVLGNDYATQLFIYMLREFLSVIEMF